MKSAPDGDGSMSVTVHVQLVAASHMWLLHTWHCCRVLCLSCPHDHQDTYAYERECTTSPETLLGTVLVVAVTEAI